MNKIKLMFFLLLFSVVTSNTQNAEKNSNSLQQGVNKSITFPVDYYWIWGHEGEIDENRFITNINFALAALKSLDVPFSPGLCGWGWTAGHFPSFDKVLPKDVFFSSISHNVGNTPVTTPEINQTVVIRG
jgi:hypothetical protein